MPDENPTVLWFEDITIDDVPRVGGKTASLGEMYTSLGVAGVAVPNGFATTASAFEAHIEGAGLDTIIRAELDALTDDVSDLAERSARIRRAIRETELPPNLVKAIADAYGRLCDEAGEPDLAVAVRSSATVEDLPNASFAGQQETYLMRRGLDAVLGSVQRCFASLYTARAISYRRDMGIDDDRIALSACIQRMVHADNGSSGVLFTLDPDTGVHDVVYVTSTWGLGETIVQGTVVPDSWYVHKDRLASGFRPVVGRSIGTKARTLTIDPDAGNAIEIDTPAESRGRPSIDESDVLTLAGWAMTIEAHYGRPMDIEWAKDGTTGELFIVQARPETVHGRRRSLKALERFHLVERGEVLVDGLAVGSRIASGVARRIESPADMYRVESGDVVVTDVTDPDWEPILARAAGLVTEQGGRTSHAAIVARELGIPAIVGCGPIGGRLRDGAEITVDCSDGATGHVLDGSCAFEVDSIELDDLPPRATRLLLNVSDPATALSVSRLPSDGIGLARMEFIYANHVGVHPLATTRPETVEPEMLERVRAHAGGVEVADLPAFVIDRLAQGIGLIAAAFWPRPVTLRLSDFKSNEYARLLGGAVFEPHEANPMIGWRGASRYDDPDFRDGFELELEAIRRVRETFGFTNLHLLVPFCRTPEEGARVLRVLHAAGVGRGQDGLQVHVMAEVPSNILCAAEFAALFDGFSIGSNDLTQLVLGVDRDSAGVADVFDETHPAVTRACGLLLETARRYDTPVSICGQAPSDHPEFASFLVRHGIDAVSVSPDAIVDVIAAIARAEADDDHEHSEPPWAVHLLSM